MIAGGAACLALLGVAVFVGVGSRPVPPPVTATPPAPPLPPPAPVVGTFGKGRTFQDVLSALGVAKDRAIQIVQALRPHLDFRRLKPQDELELHHDSSGDLAKLVYRQGSSTSWRRRGPGTSGPAPGSTYPWTGGWSWSRVS
ncbi:MAG: hypothetical protein M0C28_22920 [Candidatus Moduliflexus flocculans]|nr:hypothetical protein [Candidatus Moduliflexus flocculans]